VLKKCGDFLKNRWIEGEVIVMEKLKLERINELAKKSKKTELTPEEKVEQQALRKEYIGEFKASLKQTLESIKYE
jgi:uncharacterized protein YnzC (UPF0291/DUF896 family)